MAGSLGLGAPVRVTVRGRHMLGYVVSLREIDAADPMAPKLIDLAAAPEGTTALTEAELSLAEWVADEWLAGPGDAIRAVRPQALLSTVRRVLRLAPSVSSSDASMASQTRAPQSARLLDLVRRHGGEMSYEAARAELGDTTSSAARRLVEEGALVDVTEDVAPRGRPRDVAAVALGSPLEGDSALTEKQARVMSIVAARADPVPIYELLAASQVSRAVVEALISRQRLRRTLAHKRRAPVHLSQHRSAPPTHTDEQHEAIRAISEEAMTPLSNRRPVLIHGVTASGKTEIYLEAIRQTRDAGRGAIVLVPEIALAAQVVKVVADRFGEDVAVLHSRLSAGERHDEWQRVAAGHAGVAVGARSAVFAPVANLGLIIIDEEHEASYKQESAARYDARAVAVERTRRADATLALGSATPSIETYHAALSGRMRLAVLSRRATGASLPSVEIVDMREEFKRGPVLFSTTLQEQMRAVLEAGQQVVLFLNRRGYAQFVLCRDCGYTARCPDCAVSLTLHASSRVLRCHHCGYARTPPALCPQCQGPRLRGFGLGTERVEQEVMQLFPEARIARMDRDSTSRKGSHEQIVRSVRTGQADVLIGTQMVAKGFDFPRVTLVGVVSADTGLHIPEFRAAERTFQTLAQVAGRAGRGSLEGRVIIQTFTPDHYAVQSAARQDYVEFFTKELEQRRELRYPPFSSLANVLATCSDERDAQEAAAVAAEALRSSGASACEVIGPSPAPIERLRGKYRWHVLVRSEDRSALASCVSHALSKAPARVRAVLTADLDPVSLA